MDDHEGPARGGDRGARRPRRAQVGTGHKDRPQRRRRARHACLFNHCGIERRRCSRHRAFVHACLHSDLRACILAGRPGLHARRAGCRHHARARSGRQHHQHQRLAAGGSPRTLHRSQQSLAGRGRARCPGCGRRRQSGLRMRRASRFGPRRPCCRSPRRGRHPAAEQQLGSQPAYPGHRGAGRPCARGLRRRWAVPRIGHQLCRGFGVGRRRPPDECRCAARSEAERREDQEDPARILRATGQPRRDGVDLPFRPIGRGGAPSRSSSARTQRPMHGRKPWRSPLRSRAM